MTTRRRYDDGPRRSRSSMARADQKLKDGGSLIKHGAIALGAIFLLCALAPGACRAATDAGVIDPAAGGFGAGAVAGAGGAAAITRLRNNGGGGGGGGGGAAAGGGAGGGAAAKKLKGEEPPQTTTTTEPPKAPPPSAPPSAPPEPATQLSQRPLERPVLPQGDQGDLGGLRAPQPDRGVVINPVMPPFQTQ